MEPRGQPCQARLPGPPKRKIPNEPISAPNPHKEKHLCRSEEHTSELQSPCNLVCRLLLEKKTQDRTTSGAYREPDPNRPQLRRAWLRCTQAVVLNQEFHPRYGISELVSNAWDWRVVCLLQKRKYWRLS